MRSDNHGQNAVHPADLAVKRKLAEKNIFVGFCVELFGRNQQSDKYRKVIKRTFFSPVGRGKIDGNAADGEIKAAVFNCRAHTVTGFADCGIGQTDHIKARQSGGNISLHADGKNLHAEDSHAVDLCKHISFLFRSGFMLSS